MADYISKNILSQSYLHIESNRIKTEDELLLFREHINEFVISRTAFFLYPNANIEIDFEKGSIKSRITVMGTILILMQGIANYKDFREGIQLIYNDTKRLSEYIISEFLYESGSKHQNIIRVEARTGIIGSVQKVLTQLETIKRGADGDLTASELIEKLENADTEIRKLLGNIIDESDKIFVIKGISDLVGQLPETPKNPIDKTNSRESIVLYSRRRKSIVELLNNKIVNK